jgi:hypothetical protein
VNLVDDVPLVVGHVGESLIAEDASVVDDNVDATPGVNGCLNDSLAVLHIGLVANGLSTELLDLLNKLKSVDATKTSTSAGDNSNLAREVELLTLGVGRELAGLLEQLESIGRTLGVLRLREVDDILPLGSNSARCEGLISLQLNTLGPLPAQLSDVTSAGFEDSTGLGVRLVCEDSDERDNPLRFQLREDIGRHDGLGHSAGSDRGNDVAENVVLQTLLRERLGKPNKGELSSYSDR